MTRIAFTVARSTHVSERIRSIFCVFLRCQGTTVNLAASVMFVIPNIYPCSFGSHPTLKRLWSFHLRADNLMY